MREQITFTLTLLAFPPSVTSVCYFRNGSSSNDLDYQECPFINTAIAGHDARMCCATSSINPPEGNVSYSAIDDCLQNGLCINTAEVTNKNGVLHNITQYRRDLCTIPWWDEGCLDICPDAIETDTGSVLMTSCNGLPDSETWCCGENNTDCCSTPDAIQLQNFQRVSTPLSDGAKAGIGVGAGMGGLAIIAAFLFWFMRRHRQKKIDNTNMEKTELAAEGYTARGPQELDGNGMAHEKPAGVDDTRHELHEDTMHELHENMIHELYGECSGQHAS